MINAEARQTRARLAAHRRWHPGDDAQALAEQLARETDASRTDQAIAEILSRAPSMTAEQASRVRQIFRYLPDADE